MTTTLRDDAGELAFEDDFEQAEAVEVSSAAQEAFVAAEDAMSAAFPLDTDEHALAQGDGNESASGPEVDPALILEVPLDDIAPDRYQARDDGADAEIGESLQPDEVLPPIELRIHPHAGSFCLTPEGKATTHPPYMIVDGERRWRGSIRAGRTHIRAWVNPNPGDEGDILLRQAVLNNGRPLKAMEEARTWKRIMDAKGWNVVQLAAHVKKAKSTISDRLAMLDAPAPFQPLFLSGTLTPSAAPIVREYRALPERVLKQLLERASNDWGWRQYLEAGIPLPVENVRYTLERVVQYVFPEVEADVEFADAFTLKGKRYAIDREAYHAAAAAARRQREKTTPRAATREDAAVKQNRDDERLRKEKATRLRELRRAQFDAIAEKVPATLDDKWSMLLVRFAIQEMQQLDQSHACKALGIPVNERSAHTGYAAQKALISHAEKLGGAARLRFLLRALIAADLQVSEWSTGIPADRIIAAAKLARVDLKKVKLPAAAKTPAAKPKPTKPAKKGARR